MFYQQILGGTHIIWTSIVIILQFVLLSKTLLETI